MLDLLLVAHMAAVVPATALDGHWLLDPQASRFGVFPQIACKHLSIINEVDVHISYEEVLSDNQHFSAAMRFVADGESHPLGQMTRMSPTDDWTGITDELRAQWQADSLHVHERIPEHADAWREATYYVRADGRLVQHTQVLDLLGFREATLIYNRVTATQGACR